MEQINMEQSYIWGTSINQLKNNIKRDPALKDLMYVV